MTALPKRWKVLPPASAEHMAQLPDLPPLTMQLLYNRQVRTVDEIQAFLSRSFPVDNPYLLKGMNEAVTRLRRAIRSEEPIAVYGDYDADGVTATALLVSTLQALGARVEPFIPRRKIEGYGLQKSALEELACHGVKLVVTVDCGVRSTDEARFAQAQGLELIITDHHNVSSELPPAVAVVDPKQADESYPFKHLTGVGLAYKLAQGLLRVERCVPLSGTASLPEEEDLLDLVALGTIADLAPLTGENRALVSRGLQKLNGAPRPGVAALLQVAGLKQGQVDSRSVGYALGPRLNAAGRLGDAMASYELLLESSREEAVTQADKLDKTNQKRQLAMRQMIEQAKQEVAKIGDAKIYILDSPDYDSGIIGLVASRLLDEFYRPAVVIAVDSEKGESRGSARSIDGFHITKALEDCDELLAAHGGHKTAAGFSIKNEKIPEFRARMQELADQQLSKDQLQPSLEIDMSIPLQMANAETLQLTEALQPFGVENERPTFVSLGVQVCECRSVGADGRTLKFRFGDGTATWTAVAFRQSARAEAVPRYVDVAYTLQRNEWNGRADTELMVKDWRPAEGLPSA